MTVWLVFNFVKYVLVVLTNRKSFSQDKGKNHKTGCMNDNLKLLSDLLCMEYDGSWQNNHSHCKGRHIVWFEWKISTTETKNIYDLKCLKSMKVSKQHQFLKICNKHNNNMINLFSQYYFLLKSYLDLKVWSSSLWSLNSYCNLGAIYKVCAKKFCHFFVFAPPCTFSINRTKSRKQ